MRELCVCRLRVCLVARGRRASAHGVPHGGGGPRTHPGRRARCCWRRVGHGDGVRGTVWEGAARLGGARKWSGKLLLCLHSIQRTTTHSQHPGCAVLASVCPIVMAVQAGAVAAGSCRSTARPSLPELSWEGCSGLVAGLCGCGQPASARACSGACRTHAHTNVGAPAHAQAASQRRHWPAADLRGPVCVGLRVGAKGAANSSAALYGMAMPATMWVLAAGAATGIGL